MVGGSWRILERIAKASGRTFAIAGTGPRTEEAKKLIQYTVPWFDYEEYGVAFSVHLWGLAVLGVPLIPLAIFATIRERPRLVIANGFYSGLIALLIKRLFDIPYMVSVQQRLPEGHKLVRQLIRRVGHEGDGVFVNSQGNQRIVSEIVQAGKVQVLPLWADDTYFRVLDREALREKWHVEGRFVVLYVGRVDTQKNVDALVRVCDLLAADGRFLFVFAGGGNLSQSLEEKSHEREGFRYLGRVSDLGTLSELYQTADLVWSHADETYLSLPAIEALASGTPILISETPAIVAPRGNSQKVNPTLVPPEVGWLAEISDSHAVAKLLLQLEKEGIPSIMRQRCRALAVQHYSSSNIQALQATLERFLARPGGV